jgi:hypothetical protein
MTPSVFKRNSIRRLDNIVHADIDVPPSSTAEPPPPTFCLSSPKHELVATISPQSQTIVSVIPSYGREPTHLRSPSLSPDPFEQDSDIIIKTNLLDEADPWDAIGRLLNLNKTSSLTAPTRDLTVLLGVSMNDRSGVGYVAPQVNENPGEVGRDVGIHLGVHERSPSDKDTDHSSSSWSHIRISSPPPSPPVLTMNVALPTQPLVSSFLSAILSTEPERAVNEGDVTFTCIESKLPAEESFGTLEEVWLTLPDDGHPGPGENPHSSSENAVYPSAADSSSITVPCAASLIQHEEIVPLQVKIPNFQGPCLFFDLDDDE